MNPEKDCDGQVFVAQASRLHSEWHPVPAGESISTKRCRHWQARRPRYAKPSLASRRLQLPIAIALFIALVGFVRADEMSAPAKNWALPLYSDEGFHTMTARGSEARAMPERQFAVVDLNLTLFSGDAANRVETVILSPAATFLPDVKQAHGEKSVRFIRDDVEASGMRWVYLHDQKKISLDGTVRVTFHAELKDLLK
jgi:hypothetical protein